MEPISAPSPVLGLILTGILYAAMFSIPLYVLWLIIKALRKSVTGFDQIVLELKQLREEVKALRADLSARSPK